MDSAPPLHGSIPGPRCCCGSSDCAFLAHNGRLLEGLERDVSKAAQLGQALLIRHEAYVADSERERRQMTATIDGLEKQKLELEQKNSQTIQANRELLDQLEQLNEAVATSDAQVQALQDTLHSTEAEIERLSILASRTQDLERQLIDLEREQSQLQSALDLKIGDERTAVQRWRRAEKTIADLQDQIDRIEKEAREERERHVEIVARMERRMAVDRELVTAAGRLKAKAGNGNGGTNVVSHFVKDILRDNANLQHGIMELREMLFSSNEEVERLREQLRFHQPVSPNETADGTMTPTLQKELGSEAMLNQELHIHHHYHGPAPKPQAHRRPRKKRFNLTPAHFVPPTASDLSTSATILSHTSVTVPNSNRWSNATTLAPSLPGSPPISNRGSIYDRVFSDVPYDSSRPTSPSDSVDPESPMSAPLKSSDQEKAIRHQRKKSQSLKPPSLATIRSASTPISITAKSSPATAVISAISPANSLANDVFALSPALVPHNAIPEENEETSPNSHDPPPLAFPQDHDADDTLSPLSTLATRPPLLRRPASHESLISISGMDIHTLQSRPAQLLLSASPRFTAPAGAASVGPELTPWTATAAPPNISQRGKRDGRGLNRELLYANLSASSVGKKGSASGNVGSGTRQASLGLGKKVGGWVWGRWGAMPAPSSTASFRPPSSKSTETQSSTETVKKKGAAQQQFKLRPPGVNQSGPIWGVFDVPPTPEQVVVSELDAEALGEALGE